MSPLPIAAVIPAIKAQLSTHRALVLQAPPGAGKTTLVPLALLDEPWLAGRAILMLEPRRLAARAAAARMAELLNEPVGGTVGYRVRLESQVSANTRIEVLTEGILTRRLQNDPLLEGVGLVIFDEFHERNLQADLGLALAKESQDALRPDLRLMVMSATLDGTTVARLLDDAPVITSTGRRHPVLVHYLPRDPSGPIAETVVQAVRRALEADSGDILVFLPGGREIRLAQALLEAESAAPGIAILPLYGDLPADAQQQAIRPDPQGRRKMVLATAIAETSLTIEGIRVVVDSGWMRVPRFEPRRGLTRLDTIRVSADAAAQRAGRAGRLGPGRCYRLWSERTQQGLRPQRTPEILEADLAPLVLELAQWGVTDAATLAWLDPPPPGALAQARDLLIDIEALDTAGRITPTGRALADLPLQPRLAHMLQRGTTLGLGELACDLAALLDERDILRNATETGCDLNTRVEALRAFHAQGQEGARLHGADPAVCARVEQVARRWRRRLRPMAGPADADAVGLLLALAYPDRIAWRRDGSMNRYLLTNGRGARLHNADPLLGKDWLVAAHLDAGSNEGRIFLAAPVAITALEEHLSARIHVRQRVYWDARQATVVARQERRLGELLLAGRSLEGADPMLLRRAMREGIQRLGLDCLPWTRESRDWQARVLSLRVWYPEEGWPNVSDAQLITTLEDWLEPHLEGITRREHLERLELAAILQERLHGSLRARLMAEAPTHIQVPSGSRLRLRYIPGESPVLAVQLQEMFGLADTPRVAGGRVPVTLHLLSPARWPIQITQDLRGFWERTYAEVKKELKGRYPKHPWPDDPWTARPTAKPRPRVHRPV